MEYEKPKDIRPDLPTPPVFNTIHFAKKQQPRRTTMIINPYKLNPPKNN